MHGDGRAAHFTLDGEEVGHLERGPAGRCQLEVHRDEVAFLRLLLDRRPRGLLVPQLVDEKREERPSMDRRERLRQRVGERREALAAREVTFGVISRPSDVPDDQQAVACGAVVETAIPGMAKTLANPIRLSFAEQRTAHPAPGLGEHSEQVLRELGFGDQQIAELQKQRKQLED